MGTGTFDGEKFDFAVVAPEQWNDAEKAEWQSWFLQASYALYEATDGQLRFGRIFMADEGWGLRQAEFVLHDFDGTSYATYGGYGTLGKSVQLMKHNDAVDPKTIVHEFGHHAFRLGDEYTGPVQSDEIDTSVTPPSYNDDPPFYNVVPLLQSELDSQSLQYGYAFVIFDGTIERLIISEHTPTQLTVFNSFTRDPRTADGGRIYYQPQYTYPPEFPDGLAIGCPDPEVDDPNYCLMDHYKGEAGVTEFCSQDNHDPNGDTSHEAIHGGLSCWEVIADVIQDEYGFPFEVPNPAEAGQETDEFPFFTPLAKEARIALVMDRSGSMGEDDKIQGARFGVDQWLTNAREADDWTSVIWYNQDVETTMSLSQLGDAQADSLIAAATDVDPGGWTNIRDALLEAADQITSRDNEHGRAAVQAIVLLTDGIHNSPADSTVAEAIPALRDAGIPVYAVALGTPDNVDYDALEELVSETNGLLVPVALVEGPDGNPIPPEQHNAVIAIRTIEFNFALRNGLVSVGNNSVAGAPPDSTYGKVVNWAGGERLTIKDLARLQDLDGVDGFRKQHRQPYSFTVPFTVEAGASSASFAITHEEKQDFHLHLVDPDGIPVDFDASDAVLIAPDRPYATAIVRKPEPGLWHAVVARASTGPATRVNYVAGVENRMIVAEADCDRQVPVGSPVSIAAGAVWRDRLSDLRVTAELTGPDGSEHTIVLSDETDAEPHSGDYRGVFTPEVAGRYEGTVRIASRPGAQNAGGIHRASHAPMEDREPTKQDLQSGAPAFVRRVPIYVDVGARPTPKDLDQPGRRRRREDVPTRTRNRADRLPKLDVERALELVEKA